MDAEDTRKHHRHYMHNTRARDEIAGKTKIAGVRQTKKELEGRELQSRSKLSITESISALDE